MSLALTSRPLTEPEFVGWRRSRVERYVMEIVASGVDVDTARARAEREIESSLPHGLATASTHVVAVVDDGGGTIGTLWVGPHPRVSGAGFVFDLVISEDVRGRGAGRRAMEIAELLARDEGWTKLGLHVFGHNQVARRLYASLEYVETDVQMLKILPPS